MNQRLHGGIDLCFRLNENHIPTNCIQNEGKSRFSRKLVEPFHIQTRVIYSTLHGVFTAAV